MVRITLLLLLISGGGFFSPIEGQVIQRFETTYPGESVKEQYFGYVENSDTIKHGHYTYFFKTGKPMQEGEYKDNLLVGEWLTYYENGFLKSIWHFENGKKNGWFKIIAEDNSLIQSGKFKNGLPDSVVTSYYPTKVVSERACYQNGRLNGTQESYYDDGKIKIKISMLNGQATGTTEEFYADGGLKSSGLKSHGLWQDTVKYYFPNGKVQRTVPYNIEGKITGKLSGYYETGNKMVTNTYLIDTLNGPSEEFFPNGLLAEEGIYRNGVRDSIWTAYYPSGTIFSRGWFSKGVLSNRWSVFNEDGTIKQIGNYYNGKEEGFWQYFYKNGSLKSEGTMINGVENGVWKAYDLNGQIAEAAFYINGEILYHRKLIVQTDK